MTHLDTVGKALGSTVDALLDISKDFGASADAMPGGQTVTIRPDDRQDAPGSGAPIAVDRTLSCPACGCGFTVPAGESALQQKRRREAGMTDDPAAGIPDALKNLNRVNGHDRQNRLS